MGFRTKRQLVIIAIAFFVVLVPIAFFIYRATPSPTCFDNKQNQGEEDVDCGGPCVPCALKHPEELSVYWVRFVPVRENTYDVAAEVRNPNLKLGAPVFDYEFRFFDDSGVLVASRAGTSFVFPGETLHLVEANVETLRTLSRVSLVIQNPQWVFTDATAPDVVVGDKQFSTNAATNESTLTAVLSDRSLSDFGEVFISAIVSDANDNVIAVSKITQRDLRSGEQRPIVFLWPRSFTAGGLTTRTEVRINTLPQH